MIAQVQWVARESRPDVSGCASLQSAALPSPTVADAQLVIKACKYIKSTACQRLTIRCQSHSWRYRTLEAQDRLGEVERKAPFLCLPQI
eukprot:6583165-Pyramimonas_sp.AAC.1